MLPVIEIFYSIQGEGRYVGTPSIFMRVSGCNLRCVFKGSICDTPYSSFNPEKSKYENNQQILDDILKLLEKNPQADLVVTGGEPLLYQDELTWLFGQLMDEYPELNITVETNGTIIPKNNFADYVDLFSVSPKLSTSVDTNHDVLITKEQVERHNNTRINITALARFYYLQSVFKFVYSGPECVDEIKDLHKSIVDYWNKKPMFSDSDLILSNLQDSTYLMPEGITQEQLNNSREECVNVCLEQGWKFTDRLHITIWGDKRGV